MHTQENLPGCCLRGLVAADAHVVQGLVAVDESSIVHFIH